MGGIRALPLMLGFLLLGGMPSNSLKATLQADGERQPLKDVAGRLGMRSKWIEKNERLRLFSDWTQIEFSLHKRECLLNGHRLHLGFPVTLEGRQSLFSIAVSDWEYALQPILTPTVQETPAIRHIVLDPGHGGKDHGARNDRLGLIEKSLTLDLAKRLQEKLVKEGYRVTLTRSDDRYLALEDRASIANQASADLFLSLHFNAAANASVQGIETFIFTPPFQPSTARAELHPSDRKVYPGNARNGPSTLLGFYLHRELENSLPGPDRGLKRARFTVLRDITMPGVLIEGGFLSHDTEGRKIGSAAYRETLCDAIVEGLRTYQRTRERLLAKTNAP